ncbi:MAG: class I SAM-dependent methyltransferase [Halomonadaceae bacterium]|nr:MAG: class I SAM-dependent methyltransferase [Halomonadaceae bacterium]
MSFVSQLYERVIFSPLLRIADKALFQVRGELLQQARGRVLELGIGSGLSLPYYTESVQELVGLEPSDGLLDQCRQRLKLCQQKSASQPVPTTTLVKGVAESLPWPDDHFDTVVAFLVFCTIGDPQQAVSEVRRVLKPGGQLLFFEHVAAPEASLARWQQRCNPLWTRMACGCELTRHTRDVFQGAGFDLSAVPVVRHPAIPLPLIAPTISGAVTYAR